MNEPRNPTPANANEASDKSYAETIRESVTGLTNQAVKLGALWAEHGLTIGRLALKTTAQSLENVANMLGHLAEGMKATERAAEQGTDERRAA
jgi:hypothetical protein